MHANNPLATSVSVSQASDTGTGNACRTTLRGVPLADGDVEVATSREGAHFVFSEHTLRAAGAGHLADLRGVLWYRDAVVEHDFVAFAYDTRTSTFALGGYMLVILCTLMLVKQPTSVAQALYGIAAIAAFACVFLTDGFTAAAYRNGSGLPHCVGRTGRARLHELLTGLCLVCYATGNTAARVVQPGAAVCPGDNLAGKFTPLPDARDFALMDGACVALSFSDGGVVVVLAMLFVGRLAGQGVAFVVTAALILAMQLFNVFNIQPDGFYHVSTHEFTHRAVEPFLRLAVALIMTRIGEVRMRGLFEMCVGSAVAVARRRAAVRQLAVLQRSVADAPTSSGGGAHHNTDVIATTWAAAVCIDIAHRTSGDAPDCEELDDTFDAMQELILHAGLPANAVAWVSGPRVVALFPAALAGASDDATAAALTAAADSAADEEEAHRRAACAAVAFACAADTAVARLRAVFPVWARTGAAAKATVVGGRALASVSAAGARLVPLPLAVAEAIAAATDVAAPGRVAVAADVATFIGATVSFSSTAAGGDHAWHCVEAAVAVPTAPPRSQHRYSISLSSAALLSSAAHATSQDDDAALSNVHIPVVSWCRCCACSERNSVLRACLPCFGDPATEAAYAADDNQRVRAMLAAFTVAAVLASGEMAMLAYFDEPNDLRFVALFVIVAATMATIGGLALHACATLGARTRTTVAVAFTSLWFGALMCVRYASHATFVSAASLSATGSITSVVTPVPPDHPASRLGLNLVLYLLGLLMMHLPRVTPGYQIVVDSAPIGLVVSVLLCVVTSRRNRHFFAATLALDDTQRELADARAAMDDRLRRFMPPAYTHMLRAAPDEPLCRPMSLPAATALVVQVGPMWAASRVQGAGGDVAALLTRVQRCFADELPRCFVAAHGDSLAASVVDADGLLPLSDADTRGAQAASIVARVFGTQPPVPHHPVYAVRAFPTGEAATVRAGMHRGGLVVGLTGATRLAFSVMGPALDGATKLSQLSIALGCVAVSSEADWRIVATHDVPGIGPVRSVRIA